MQDLDKAINEVLGKIPNQILSQLLTEKLKAQGLVLSKNEQRKLVARILAGETIPSELRSWQFWKREPRVVIQFTPKDANRITELAEKLAERLPEIVESTTSTVAGDVLATLKRRWAREVRRQEKEMAGFRRRLHERWGAAIGSLQMLLTISREYGASMNSQIRASPSDKPRYRVEVLMRLHARACQVVEEIVSLLSVGLADGAMARWRTLHEIAVVALLVSKNREELAERYITHQHVESLKAAHRYQECYESLGHDPMTPEEMKLIEDRYKASIDRYGASFCSDYGWAAEVLRNKKPNFSHLEKSVGLAHFRAHYRMAADNVHANPKGAFSKLGLLDETAILLAGPSNAGLADPGHSAAISLAQISTTLFALQPTFDNLVALKTMVRLKEEVGQAFIDAHQQLLQDEAQLRKHP